MRAVILPLLLAAALLAAPVAIADGDRSHGDAGKTRAAELRADHAPDHDDNDTEDANETPRGKRNASYRENHTALIDRIVESIHALRASWHENATKVREDCKAADLDHRNESKDNRTARAHCIRDGYREWRAAHTAEFKELREQIRALKDSRRPSDD